MKSPRRFRALGAITLASTALFAAGCGDDSEAGSATTATPPVATEAAPTVTNDVGTIVDAAAGNPEFSILVAAVTKAGLAETLSGPGPFTVFAPTDAAFAAALKDLGITKVQLLASPALGKILTYHVLPGKVMAADITGPLMPKTVQGAKLSVALKGGKVKVGPAATVVTADVPASNGVIHAIDAVLLPPGVKLG